MGSGSRCDRGGHRLDPLLSPRSIALVGASPRRDTNGHALVEMTRIDGYPGRIWCVNPRYREIEGLPTVAAIADLPERVDHIALSISAEQLEAGLDAAIAHGAKAVTIFGACQLDDDVAPPLAERLRRKASAAGLAMCGGSSMGFYNRSLGLRIASFPSPPSLRAGGIAWIAQSGSAFSALAHNDRRLGFSLCVSSGMEMTTTAADYADWALTRPQTRVVGLFLEQVRDPDRFTAMLETANARDIPVAVLKVGRTARSAAMALSHTGAMAGNDTAFVALCRRHGVILVDDLDEMAAVLQTLDHRHRPAEGRLATFHDSGGERELVVDIAERVGVDFAEISEETKARIAPHLDPGLVAENPLDAWGTARDFVDRYASALGALVDDAAVGAGVFFTDIREGYWYSAGIAEAVRRVAAQSTKPVMIATNYSKTFNQTIAFELARDGIPVLEGTREGLLAIKHAFAWRDRRRDATRDIPPLPDRELARWRARLATGRTLGEDEGLQMLGELGLPVIPTRRCQSMADALAAAGQLEYPVALKTAAGIAHKSDVGGVHLSLMTAEAVTAAYRDLEARLGGDVVVSAMASPGIEIGLGAIVDVAFGPLIVVSAGGTLIEVLADTACELAPCDEADARAMLARLRTSRLLDGVRGRPPCDREALARTIVRFSAIVAALADVITEIDINPLIVSPSGAIAVDALIVGRKDGHQ